MTYMQSLAADVIERKRHNEASETQAQKELAETIRSHKVNEALSEADLNEKIRHQLAQDTETMRNHLVTEAEIAKHNRETEAIQRQSNQIQRYAAELNYQAQNNRNLNERMIEQMKIDSNEMIEAAKRRIDQANSESARKQAEAALKKAAAEVNKSFASMDMAEASLREIDLREKQAPFETVESISRSTKNITASMKDVEQVITGSAMLPDGRSKGTASGAKGNKQSANNRTANDLPVNPNYDTSTFAPKTGAQTPKLSKNTNNSAWFTEVGKTSDGRSIVVPNEYARGYN